MSEVAAGCRGLVAVGLLALGAGSGGCVAVSGSPEYGLAALPEPVMHESVLLRGRVGPEMLELDPVMVISGPAAPAPAPAIGAGEAGAYLLRGLDAAGELSFEIGLQARELGTLPGSEVQHFNAVAPVGPGGAMTLERVELHSADGRLLERRARIGAAALDAAIRQGTALAVRSLGGGQIRVEWDAGTFPLVQLRDPDGGEVLAVGRAGIIELATDAEAIEVAVSEGVRSAAYRYALR